MVDFTEDEKSELDEFFEQRDNELRSIIKEEFEERNFIYDDNSSGTDNCGGCGEENEIDEMKSDENCVLLCHSCYSKYSSNYR